MLPFKLASGAMWVVMVDLWERAKNIQEYYIILYRIESLLFERLCLETRTSLKLQPFYNETKGMRPAQGWTLSLGDGDDEPCKESCGFGDVLGTLFCSKKEVQVS
jgi:hypothetical protein